jgi:hypothetical protein
MKLSRDDLKGIVKECLVEILSEGLSQTTTQINESKSSMRQEFKTSQKPPVTHRSGVADKISFLPKGADQSSQKRPIVDKNVIRTATTDPILQEMLADTATRGTPIMEDTRGSTAMHESSISIQGDVAAKQMLRSDPTDVFGEASSKWATLAFAEKKIGA